MSSHRPRQSLAVSILIAMGGGVHAQTDAGALMRQTEEAFRANQTQRAWQHISPIEAPLVLPAGSAIRVSAFSFVGVHRIETERLQAAVAAYAQRELTTDQLENLCTAVVDAYRQAGWVVRVYVPQQTLPSETLTLRVLETVPPPSPK